jgi:diguanylate cyclase (GGDEF)-like protein/PAS domain S-box-containing protein
MKQAASLKLTDGNHATNRTIGGARECRDWPWNGKTMPTEKARIDALHRTGLLGTPSSSEFDALVALASSIFRAPIASIALVGEHKQWFKAKHGFDFDEADRLHSFANHVVRTSEPFIVADALGDERFSKNVFVESLNVRSYAGAPLFCEGRCVGSICIMDRSPHAFQLSDLTRLRQLAVIASGLIREHKQKSLLADQQRELEIRQKRFEQTEQSAKVGGFEVDLSTGRISWSDQIYRNVGLPVGLPLTSEIVIGCYGPEERERVRTRLQKAANGQGTGTDDDYRIITPEGEERWMHIVSDLEYIDGKACRLFGIVQDITDRSRQERRLFEAANTDALTGLANRNRFKTILTEQIAKGSANFGLLLVDVDRFKQLNDTLGHAAGDAVLKEVAQRLLQIIGKRGAVCRLGGDEFAVIVDGSQSKRSMSQIAKALIGHVSQPMLLDCTTITPQITVGGAIFERSLEFDAFCQNADFALYHAKEIHRGGYVHFETGLRTEIGDRITIIRQVEDALLDDRILPHYHPIVAIGSGELVGMEALARMIAADGSIIPAIHFHHALKDPSISHQVTTRMLECVTADANRWRKAGLRIGRIGINVSTSDFVRGDLESRIVSTFGRHDLPLDMLTIEVTETVFLEGVEDRVATTLRRLRKKGVYVALDDFGTGYASLTHLRSLPVDIIKIDKSFVDNLLSDKSSQAIVRLVVDLATRLSLRVTAEGIETLDQATWLQEVGCLFGQGYLYSKPIDAAMMELFARIAGNALPCETAQKKQA